MRAGRRSVRIGLAVRHDLIVARVPSMALPGGEWHRSLDGAATPDGRWPALESALADLRAALPPDARVAASIALLSPLVQLRRVTLPPLRAEERRRVLGRDAARYFVGAREPFVADGLPIAGSPGELMAAGAAARAVEAIVRAAVDASILVRTIQAAPWCWAASIDASRRATVRALVTHDDRSTDVVSLARGEVTGIRRRRTTAEAPDISGEISGTIAEIADSAAIAATFADRARGPELLPESALALRRAVTLRRARTLAGAAAALLVLSAGIELLGVRHQLAVVREERAALHVGVARALASRDSATALETQLAVVGTEVAEAPKWTSVIAGLSRHLPRDAWLTSFAASGDSIALVGQAAHAAEVFEALRRHPGIAGIRADAPIRREMAADRAPVERFSITVRMSRRGLLSVPDATDGNGGGEP